MRIVLCYPVNEGHIAQIQAAAPEAEIIDHDKNNVGRASIRMGPERGAGFWGD